MKYKHFTVLLWAGLLAFTSKGQTFTLAVESGYSINRAAAAGVNLGLNFRDFNIRGGFDAHMTNKTGNGAVFHAQLGHTVDFPSFYITPGLGYGFIYKSADNKSLNEGGVFWNIESGKKLTFREQEMALYASYSQVSDFKMVLLGIRAYF